MKYVHYIGIRVFSDEKEIDKVLSALERLAGIDLKEEKVGIKETKAEGFDKKITIFELGLKKVRHTNRFLKNLIEKLNEEDKEKIIKEIESRLDERNNFFLRLDKSKLLKNEYKLTDSGDCFRISMNIATYPSNREKAKEVVKDIFE